MQSSLFTGAALPASAWSSETEQFQRWDAERVHVEALFERTPEADELLRDGLLDRAYELRQLLINTPTKAHPAVRIKARLLLWQMEQERSDDLPAMRHICAFLDGLVR